MSSLWKKRVYCRENSWSWQCKSTRSLKNTCESNALFSPGIRDASPVLHARRNWILPLSVITMETSIAKVSVPPRVPFSGSVSSCPPIQLATGSSLALKGWGLAKEQEH